MDSREEFKALLVSFGVFFTGTQIGNVFMQPYIEEKAEEFMKQTDAKLQAEYEAKQAEFREKLNSNPLRPNENQTLSPKMEIELPFSPQDVKDGKFLPESEFVPE